jgi:hypothetical protein
MDCEAFAAMYSSSCQAQVAAFENCWDAKLAAAKCECGANDNYIHCNVAMCDAQFSNLTSCATSG